MSTEIWLKDPSILFNKDKIKDIWPSSGMTSNERVNAITRLVIILTILGYILTLSIKIIVIGIVALLCIVGIYLVQQNKEKKENKQKESFSNKLSEVFPAFTDPQTYDLVKDNLEKPNNSNPLMNVMLPEIKYNPKRKGAAPSFNPTVEKEINENVKENIARPFNDKKIRQKLFSNINDELEFNSCMRQFYSTANTRIPNDQKGFAEFAYGDMISGKEGNKQALTRNHTGAYGYVIP